MTSCGFLRRRRVDGIPFIFLFLISNSVAQVAGAAPVLTSMSASPLALAAPGGNLVLSVNVQADLGVQSAQATIVRPDGEHDAVALTRTAGSAANGTWQGQYAITRNFTAAAQIYLVTLSAQDTAGTTAQAPPLAVTVAPPDAAAPAIVFTSVPAFGSFAPLQGRVLNVAPQGYKVAVQIFVEGLGFFSKPYCSPLFITPLTDGTWSASITTGGVDPTATLIVAYLVPVAFDSSCRLSGDGLPPDLEAAAVARVIASRTDPNLRVIHFANQDWWIKSNSVPLGPGPTNFSNSANNASVDTQGRLHLKLTNVNGTWYGAEVVSQNVTGNGIYRFYLDSPVYGIDPSVVWGLFTWSPDPIYSHRELDAEMSKFGNADDTNNAQFVVQPYTVPGNQVRFQVPPTVTASAYSIQWYPSTIAFKAAAGLSTDPTDPSLVIEQVTNTRDVPPPGLDVNVRMNVWLFNGLPPTNGQEAEFIIRDFQFVPLTVTADSASPSSGSGLQQTFQMQYSDSAGVGDISGAWAWFASAASPSQMANSCVVYYAPVANQVYLMGDSGAGWAGPATLGSPGSIGNSQCSLDPHAANATASGTQLTLTIPVTFAAPFTGAHGMSLQADGLTVSSGWQALGSWTVPVPALSIVLSPSGSLTQGQTNAEYTITVANQSGAGTTAGPVTVTESLPAGLTLVSMSGAGWNCSGNSCSRSDLLAGGASYPAITVIVNVAANALSPLVNTATVSGGGSPPETAAYTTVINPNLPALIVAKTHVGNFTQGRINAVYNITVSNQSGAGATNAPVSVTDLLPVGLTLVSMSGTGWTCQNGVCVRNDALAGGSSYPSITVTVNVANNAASPLSNVVLVSGGSTAPPVVCVAIGCPGAAEDVTVVNPNGPVNLSLASIDFGVQQLGAQTPTTPVIVTNTGTAPLHVTSVVLSGAFYGDYSVAHNCGAVQPSSSCQINVLFAPGGTGPRPASLLVIDDSINSPQAVRLGGSGIGSCATVSQCAYVLLNQRVNQNQTGFFVYRDSDSAFNHGFPSGLFGTIDLTRVVLDSTCVDDPGSPTGCSTDRMRLDGTRGTVFRFAFPQLGASDYVGVNFQDPESYDEQSPTGTGYNLNPATLMQLDVRSPGGAVAQFGVGGCVTAPYSLSPQWQTIQISLADLLPPKGSAQVVCPPDLTNTHILFTIATSQELAINAGTVLVDNIQFLPMPLRQATDPKALSLPLGNLTFGTPPQTEITPDQANRNLSPIYEAAATVLSLLSRAQAGDVTNALRIVDALDYALHHESRGDPLPAAKDGSVALHSAYFGGDIALQNTQATAGGSQAGDVRLAGFSGDPASCPPSGFCLVLDGATGGNNAWAMLAFIAAYARTGTVQYLNDAETIGNWIAGVLTDNQGFRGYLVGISDSGPGRAANPPVGKIPGKSTENNGDIFAAFSMVAGIERALGHDAAADQWTARANWAGDFVTRMYDGANGRFYTGTVAPTSTPAPGNCQDVNVVVDQDRLNTCDFLDSNTFTLLPMALSTHYKDSIDWNLPLQYSLAHFAQTVTAAGRTWNGFDLVPAPTTNGNGIAWEFTGQMVAAMRYLDKYLNAGFQPIADADMAQIQAAQSAAPFGDGLGLPASTVHDGDTLPPALQCLSTPFQCIPERVGLAASNWGVYAENTFNPLAFGALIPLPWTVAFPDQPQSSTSQRAVVVTNVGITPVTFGGVTIGGPNASEFGQTNTCTSLSAGASCSIQVTFSPTGPDLRTVTLQIASDAIASPLLIPLSGNSLPPNDFDVTVNPAQQTVVAGNTTTLTVATTVTRGVTQPITLSATCGGLTVDGGPGAIQAGDPAATIRIVTTTATVPETYPCTVTAVGSFATRTGTASVTVVGPIATSPASLGFGSRQLGTGGSPMTLTVSNRGPAALAISIILSGPFSGDFAQTNTCGASLSAGANCVVSVTFTPSGTGPRRAALLILDAAGDSPQTAQLSGSGLAVCAKLSDCGYQLMNARASAGQNTFYVYKDADSGLNHGFPSGIFGSPTSLINAVVIDSGCIDSVTSPTGCSADATSLDGTRGTVFRVTLPGVTAESGFDGLNFQDPQDYDEAQNPGAGYNLTGSTAVQFDMRSPDGAVVQFGVGGCVTGAQTIGKSWTTVRLSLTTPSDLSCVPDLTNVNLLFAVATNRYASRSGGTVLLDNIQFLPAPGRQSSDPQALSLPVSTETFGALPAQYLPIPPDQVNRGVATVRETALSVIALLRRGQAQDVSNGLRMADALDYALYHDNHGDPIPTALGSAVGCYAGASATQCGLHSAYINGDVAFLNRQPPPEMGQAGDVRLAGFSAGADLCGSSGFCLVLDGTSGGNNAMAILSFLEAYRQSGNAKYLNDAITVGNWIVANLADASASTYGGYFAGYSDGGLPKSLLIGKSTADNAVIFAALRRLAQILTGLGRTAETAQWTAQANSAGDFVAKMFVPASGRFVAGTAPQQGSESLNTADSLDSNTLAALALAGTGRYPAVNLEQTLQYVLANFSRSVTSGGVTYGGFQLAAPPSGSPAGIWWEGTAQVVEAMQAVDASGFAAQIALYLSQMRTAQTQSVFGDGMGLPVATIQNGESLPPYQQCLSTPNGCLPERVGLAATVSAAFAELGINSLAITYVPPTVPAGILNNPSFELGLSVPASFTGTWYGGASAATGWYIWNNSPGTTMTELCTATSCPSGKIPPAPVDGTHTLHVTATGAWSGIYQVFPATTLASAGLWLDVISGTVVVELLGPGGPIVGFTSSSGVLSLPAVGVFNEIVIYSLGGAADFYVDGAVLH